MTNINSTKLGEFLTSHGVTSLAGARALLSRLPPSSVQQLAGTWAQFALPHQRMPDGAWRYWVCRCGRGAGKTYTGGKTVNEVAAQPETLKGGDIAIIARTHRDVRKTCVEGPSGVLKTASPSFMPIFSPGNMTLTWPNGVVAHLYSGDRPEGIRGLNAAFIWADEVCFWPGDLEAIWKEAIDPALRIGRAQGILTTTPLPNRYMQDMEKRSDVVVTRGSTFANPHLDPASLDSYRTNYAGTRAGAQELEGEYLDESERLLWTMHDIADGRVSRPEDLPEFSTIVIGVDPAVTANANSDLTGIIVAALGRDPDSGQPTAYILDDATCSGSPSVWPQTVARLAAKYRTRRVVAESNQGGELVRSALEAAGDGLEVKLIHASSSKVARAQPISVWYQRGLVRHYGVHVELEKEQTTWVPGVGKSPNRVDALVYAVQDLLAGPTPITPAELYEIYS